MCSLYGYVMYRFMKKSSHTQTNFIKSVVLEVLLFIYRRSTTHKLTLLCNGKDRLEATQALNIWFE